MLHAQALLEHGHTALAFRYFDFSFTVLGFVIQRPSPLLLYYLCQIMTHRRVDLGVFAPLYRHVRLLAEQFYHPRHPVWRCINLICRMSSEERSECADRALRSTLNNTALGLEALGEDGICPRLPSYEPPWLGQPASPPARIHAILRCASREVIKRGYRIAQDYILLSPV